MPLMLGIAGHSGAGKTTLIEALIPRLAARGLRVGVLKHDAHRLDLDRPGKDTARFFAAGATTVCAHDPTQWFVRTRSDTSVPLAAVVADLPADLDLVLVEGHKSAPIEKLVLEHPEPREAIVSPLVLATVAWGAERLTEAESLVVDWLARTWQKRSLGVAVFMGGQSRRMGLPKGLLEFGGRSLIEHVVAELRPIADRLVLVGDPTTLPEPELTGAAVARCRVPVVADTPAAEGPLAGLLALLRHDNARSWLLVGCDQPMLGRAHLAWLRAGRRPGAWVVLPQLAGRAHPEPFGAIVEPELRSGLERAVASGVRALHEALASAPVAQVTVPTELARGWQSANTPAEWLALTGAPPRLAVHRAG